MNNLIRLLKDNEKSFGLMSEKMKEKAREVGKDKFLLFVCQGDGFWQDYFDFRGDFDDNATYRLRLDYTDEPEIVECEIYPNANHYLVYDGKNKIHTQLSISKVCDNPDFIGFKFKDGTVMGSRVKYSVPGITSHGYYATYEDLKTGQALEHHATHVLFRRKKKQE